MSNGLDPSGTLSSEEMLNLMVQKYHSCQNNPFDQTEQSSYHFKVTCKFTNVSWNEFLILVEDVRIQNV